MVTTLYIFRRDLRLEDNTALIKALGESEKVLPIFILNPKQVTEENEYYNTNAIEFLFNSLKDLNKQLKEKGSKLHLFYGKQLEIIKDLVKQHKITTIYQNKDYTPFARKRDQSIKELCKELDIECKFYHDYMLNTPKAVLKDDKTPYGVYSPYWKKAALNGVQSPKENTQSNYLNLEIGESLDILNTILPTSNPNILVKGGRSEALNIINNELKEIKDYSEQRNIPSIRGTSRLSAHLKFGTISPRELYYILEEKLEKPGPIQKQLYWKDFWTYIAYHKPTVFTTTYIDKYANLNWQFNEEWFNKWCSGETGFPIVDAGMRELNETGYMHNRVRMIVASFLTKDLHISYKYGEKYFAQKLTDYDPCLNNGNWQWSSSTGCDGQPYFRIFNPWRQQERFDPECEYIKKWVPELKEFSPKAIHNLFKIRPLGITYTKPLVKHEQQTEFAKSMFKI